MKHFNRVIAPVVAILVSGCMQNDIPQTIEGSISFQEDRYHLARMENASFKRHEVPFLSNNTFEEPEPLPAFLSKRVYLQAERPLGLKYYVNNIANQIGKPVRVGQDIYSVDTLITTQLQASSSDISATSSGNDGGSVVDRLITDNQKKQSPLAMKETLKLTGSAKQALNSIASAFNIHWKYSDSDVTFYKLDTRNFRLDLLSKEELETSFTGSTSTGSEGGLTTKLTSTLEVVSFETYASTIKSMLSPYGTAHVLGNSGAVVVTDTPEKLDAVAAFLESENKNLTSQVALDVEVVRITSNDGQDIGIVWDELLADLGDISLSGVSRRPSLSASPVNEIASTFNSGRLTGSKLILQALAQKAKIQVVTRETRTALNNTPTVLRDISVIEYPSDIQQTVSEGITTTSTTKETIRPGFDMTLTPRILDDNRVILKIATTMTRDLPFDEVSNGGNIQKFAQLIQKQLSATQAIREGETAMITGYLNKNLTSTEDGVGKSDFWLLGGGRSSNDGKDLLVIFVTPHITRG